MHMKNSDAQSDMAPKKVKFAWSYGYTTVLDLFEYKM